MSTFHTHILGGSMDKPELGVSFEREIREQPSVWERLAESNKAVQLAEALDDDIVLVGSGSSLFAARLGALALRRRSIRAEALAASEARLDHAAYENKTVVAISQSGRSTDVLHAIDVLRPTRLIALTNTAESPLGARADLTIDVDAGRELAVPATKSVTSTMAILLRAASLLGREVTREASALLWTARTVRKWLDESAREELSEPAQRIALRRHLVFLGSDYGWPIAQEVALKFKEAAYMHAEGFSAGEFRHGSIAMVDASYAVIGIVDSDALPALERPMQDVRKSDALRYLIGRCQIDGVQRLGPTVEDPYNTLAWLVTAQMLALYIARISGIDSDHPRGLTKAVITK